MLRSTARAMMKWRAIAGFWPRTLAFGLDFLVLGTIGSLLGLFWGDAFALLGSWGRFLGFGIALLYFGIQNSALCGGRTLGKRILGLVTVNRDRSLLTLPRSLARSFLLLVPFLAIPLEFPNFTLSFLLDTLFCSYAAVFFYLFVFNHRTRQTIHDLACGTLVIRSKSDAPLPDQPIRPIHYKIAGILALLSVAAALTVWKGPFERHFRMMTSLQAHLYEMPDVSLSHVALEESHFWSHKRTTETKTLAVKILYKKPQQDLRKRIDEVWNDIRAFYDRPPPVDEIVIHVGYGYDIGIASNFTSAREVKNISSW